MNKVIFCFVIFLSLSIYVFSQNSLAVSPADFSHDAVFYNDVTKWFSAWRLVSRKVFKIKSLKPVEFVFFDDKYVYSTSSVTIPDGEIVKGPEFLGNRFVWKKALHKNSIKLPSNETVPIGLMSFAAELKGEKSNSFFIMPLSTFWQKSGVNSPELGLQNLITGVFLHEFSHSQQMQNFGRKISEYEKTTSYSVNFTDDIVQDLFGKDASYTELYKQETETFYQAANSKETVAKISLTKKGINLLKLRHSRYFNGVYESLGNIDNFFLTMEGLGQFVMYAWLTNQKGGNIPSEKAIVGVRRGGKWWSQDEGFVLFLLLASYEKPEKWGKDLFGIKTTSVVELLQNSGI
jgi:hypothetical protein